MNSEELLTKIKSTGYWRVVIRPTVFKKDRISSLSDVRRLVQSCVVSLRGWDYPYWRDSEAQNVSDWVECSINWQEHIAYCRFYQSGQFVHHFAVCEDHRSVERMLSRTTPPLQGHAGYLDFVSTIYTVTEIFEFAARLSGKQVLQPSAYISIELYNMANHQLFSYDRSRHISDYQFIRQSNLPLMIQKEFTQEDLVSRTDELALDAIGEIFEQFNWNNPPRQIFAEDQRRLRERRF